MMAQNGKLNGALAMAAVVLLAAGSAVAASSASFDNGLRVTLHDASEIAAACTVSADGSRVLSSPLAGSVTLAPATRTLYPFDADVVMAALGDMRGFTCDVEVEVFILDAIPADIGSSFARRGAIFLSPSYAPLGDAITAYITTHEMGHVLTWAAMDGHQGRWEAYAALRGLDLAAAGADAPHALRAREILAEDFRYLFGGILATANIGLENHTLATPDRVGGLREMLVGYLADTTPVVVSVTSRAFPNPCNPRTTIELLLPSDMDATAGAEIDLYDIRGQLVRKLQTGDVANGRVTATWDGSDDLGRLVPSGRYLYVARIAGTGARGSITLVR
jgi:hypothetical protein